MPAVKTPHPKTVSDCRISPEGTGRADRLRPCVQGRQQPVLGHPLWEPKHHLVEYERWIIASPQDNRSLAKVPDLLIAFNISPEDYRASNGYVISEQGKRNLVDEQPL